MADNPFSDLFGGINDTLASILPESLVNPARSMGLLQGSSSSRGVTTSDLPPASPSNQEGNRFDLGRMAYRYYVDKGLTPDQAAAWAGNYAWESGGRPDNVRENDAERQAPDAPHSAGIAQWNGQRLRNLFQFARARGIDIPEGDLRNARFVREMIARVPLNVQLDFSWDEAQGPERRAFSGITAGRDLRSANMGAISYFRPRGWTIENPAGGEAFPNREALGQRILAMENTRQPQDRSADAGMASDPAMMVSPPPMGAVPGAASNMTPPNPQFAGPGQAPTPGGRRPDPFAGLNLPRTNTPFGNFMNFFSDMGLAAPSQGRFAAQSGSMTGYLDTLRGVPATQDVDRMLEATRDVEARQGISAIAQRAGQIAMENPGVDPQRLYTLMLTDRQIAGNLVNIPPNQAATLLQSLAKNAGQEEQFQALGPGQTPGRYNPVTRQWERTGPTLPPADVLETEYEMNLLRTNPEEFARYMTLKRQRSGSQNVRPTAEVVVSGSERARALGINSGRQGERMEVKFERDPLTGLDRVVDVNFPDRPPIDLGQLGAQETVRNLVRQRGEIQRRQSAVINAARIAERINEQLDTAGETAQGLLGAVTRASEGITSQAAEAARLAGVPLDATRYREALAPFIKAGANSAATQSNIVALAFMLARAQNTDRVTDADMQRALEQLGSGMTGSTAQMRAALAEMMNNSINGVDDTLTVQRQDFENTEVTPPRTTRDMLTQLGLTRYNQPPAPAGRTRSYGEGELERMALPQLLAIDPRTLSPVDARRAMRRMQMLKQSPANERFGDDPNP